MEQENGRLVFRKGEIRRLHRPEDVTAGKWYLVVDCKNCGKEIYIFSDPHEGRLQNPFTGDRLIQIPCHSCYFDDTYKTGEVHPHQALKNINFRLPRLEPSGGGRQPLLRRYGTVRPIFGSIWLEDRPIAAAAIGRCIVLWTDVEGALARLLACLLKINTEPALAVFMTLRSSRAQSEVLHAAAKATLQGREYEMFQALMRITSAAEKERNHLAHGSFGGAYAISKGVLWIDPLDLLSYAAKVSLEGSTPEIEQWFRERTYVYEPEDIETINRSLEQNATLLKDFTEYLALLPGSWRDVRFNLLEANTSVAKEIVILRRKQQP